MVPVSSLLGLFLLLGSSSAVFYTKSTDNEYPRIGRRAFYTTGNGYPRIGRRSGYADGTADQSPSGHELLPELSAAFVDKRGLYTSGGGYPRVGRSGAAASSAGVYQALRDNLLRKMAELNSVESGGEEEARSLKRKDGGEGELGLDLMFIAFDENGDNQLSKEEFTRGMDKYRHENPLC